MTDISSPTTSKAQVKMLFKSHVFQFLKTFKSGFLSFSFLKVNRMICTSTGITRVSINAKYNNLNKKEGINFFYIRIFNFQNRF